jgi:hypothetical protein
MRRLFVAGALAAALALPSAVSAHPSENRADQSTFGGPHCHTNLASGMTVFNSHGAHAKQNEHKPSGTVFTPVTCPD